METNELLTNNILDLFDTNCLDVKDRLEIIANLLIREGMKGIPPEYLPEKVTPENLMAVVLDLKENYEETIEMAMIHQGLVLLMWLEI